MIGGIKTITDVGLYSAARSLAFYISFPLGALLLIYMPVISGLYGGGKIDEMKIYGRALTEAEVKEEYNKNKINGDEGLVAYWSFDDGTAKDEAGGNNGTIHGAKVVEGISGNALEFDGLDDYVDCGNDPSLRPSSFTYELWVKRGMVGGASGFILGSDGQNNADCSDGTGIYMRPNGSINYVICNGNCNCGNRPAIHSYIEPDVWHHIVATYQGNNNTMSLYINGEFRRKNNQ